MTIKLQDIDAAVCACCKITWEELHGDTRPFRISHPRQIAIYLGNIMAGKSTTGLGHWYGRDHSSCIHAIRVVKSRMIESSDWRTVVGIIETNIRRIAAVREFRVQCAGDVMVRTTDGTPWPQSQPEDVAESGFICCESLLRHSRQTIRELCALPHAEKH